MFRDPTGKFVCLTLKEFADLKDPLHDKLYVEVLYLSDRNLELQKQIEKLKKQVALYEKHMAPYKITMLKRELEK
jgi:hypothetical protein